jgi:MFS family permease
LSETPSSSVSWKQVIHDHFLLFGFYLTSKDELKRILTSEPRKRLGVALLNAVGCAAIISLAVQGIMDGPEVLSGYLAGNFTIWSKTLFGWGIYTFLFLFALIFGIGFFLPFLFYFLLNRRSEEPKKLSTSAIILISCYALFPIIFITPIIYCITILTFWKYPQRIRSYEGHLLFAFGVLVAIGLVMSTKFISIYKEKV